jgi:hypothetical protein
MEPIPSDQYGPAINYILAVERCLSDAYMQYYSCYTPALELKSCIIITYIE